MTDLETELEALIDHMAARDVKAHEFAFICAVSIGCLLHHHSDGTEDKQRVLGRLGKTSRSWAGLPPVH